MDRLIELGAALVVTKEEVSANRDYNLNGERYRKAEGRCLWVSVTGSTSDRICRRLRSGSQSYSKSAIEVLGGRAYPSLVCSRMANIAKDTNRALKLVRDQSEVSASLELL